MASDATTVRGRRLRRRGYAVGVVAIAIGAALAGCASSGGGSTASSTPPPSTAGSPRATGGTQALAVKQTPGGASYVTDGAGDSLYMLSSDSNGQSTCTGQCATFWPPVSGSATAGSEIPAVLTKFQRSDGTSQAVLNGHPLYTFKMDSAPGQTNGEGVTAFGGTWTLIDPSGSAIMSLSGSSQPPAGGGYGGGG
ncbi:MAG TPA: hypothetical protein VH442_11235 [Micromonosporaceae bacterium]